ncbi:MAG: hypothetical protein WB689_18620 [Xanthobacteraceae bacterium]
MSAVQALELARAAGVQLEIDGDDLLLEAAVPPPAAVIELLARHKADILTLLRPAKDARSVEDWRAFFDERAGIAEFEGRLPRTSAEARAFESCVIKWIERNPAPSPAGRCVRCERIETQDAVVLPYGAGPGTHAWLHAECWRPWHDARRAQAVEALKQMGIRPIF